MNFEIHLEKDEIINILKKNNENGLGLIKTV